MIEEVEASQVMRGLSRLVIYVPGQKKRSAGAIVDDLRGRRRPLTRF